VSSQAVQRQDGGRGLQVVVDLSLCGARLPNYDPAQLDTTDPALVAAYGSGALAGCSAVDLAVQQMESAGVQVLPHFEWGECGGGGSPSQPT
jgi:hypothetical protein